MTIDTAARESATHAAGGADPLPRHTTPTWEVELLISGVAVFAMLQLPGWLDDAVFAWMPRVDASWNTAIMLLYFYAKSAAVILAVSFVSHLLLRAQWIALVGMHSVYPEGVRWERLRMGAVQRDVERQRQIGTDVVIERADNRATIVFALGVSLATILVTITALLGASFFVMNVLARLTGLDVDAPTLFVLLFACVVFPFAVLTALDRAYGHTWAPGGRRHRFASALLRFSSRLGLGRGNNRIMALMASHGGDRRMVLLTVVIMSAVIGSVMLAYRGMQDTNRLGNYALFPNDHPVALMAAHYDDQRNPARDPAAPYVQSMVVRGPYLKLTVPYRPRIDEPALQRQCPAARDAGRNRAQRLLACLEALHPVSLDGTPIDLHYDPGSDARTDRPALVALIDIRGLAPGRHELRVVRAPAAGTAHAADAAVDQIAFWR